MASSRLQAAVESALSSSCYDAAAVQHLLNADDLRHTRVRSHRCRRAGTLRTPTAGDAASTTSCSPQEVRNEQPDGAVAGSHHQSAVQDAADADDRLAVRHAGRAGDSREEEPHRLSRSTAAGRDRRAGTQHDRAAHPRSSSAAGENAGGVRLHAVAECDGGEDARPGRGRLHRTRRTGPVHRRLRHRQDPSADRTLRGGLPAEAAGAIHHRRRRWSTNWSRPSISCNFGA